MRYCQNCGKEIYDNTAICPYCGCKTPNHENQGLAIAAFVLAFIMPLIGFILGCVGVGQYQNKSNRGLCIAAIVLPLVWMPLLFFILFFALL